MKRLVIALTAVVLVCGVSYGQKEPRSNYEYLKSFDEFIGTWRYDGPLLEDVPDVAKKGNRLVYQLSYKWILNKNAVEVNWIYELPKTTFKRFGKSLICWNAAESQIVAGGVGSSGDLWFGTLVVDEGAKSWTEEIKVIRGDGNKGSWKSVLTKTDGDTITCHPLERDNEFVKGPGPTYTLKQVKRPKQPLRLKQAKQP